MEIHWWLIYYEVMSLSFSSFFPQLNVLKLNVNTSVIPWSTVETNVHLKWIKDKDGKFSGLESQSR